jgi:hypothetical protein
MMYDTMFKSVFDSLKRSAIYDKMDCVVPVASY